MTVTMSAATAATTVPKGDLIALEVLLLDRDWVAAEFAAIMNASGFRDKTGVATLSARPSETARRHFERESGAHARDALAGPRGDVKVRSPPGR